MKRITEKIKSNIILVSDGAWGTYLYQKGLQQGECPEMWNITHPDDVLDIAKSYIEAGADIIETNTFGGSSIKLESYNLQERAFELNNKGAAISREAAGDKIVMGSIGPTGKFLIMGDVTEEELYQSFKEQAIALQIGGADAVIIETFYALDEAELAIKAVKENTELEIVCSFTFDKLADNSCKTMTGVSPTDMVQAVAKLGIDIIGTNCGNGFEGMIDILKEMRAAAPNIPLLVQANAGLPFYENGALIYPTSPEIAAEIVPLLINAGANIIGGCCGTTPEHIKSIRDSIPHLKLKN